MSSARGDLTARAVIRGEALRLFAQRGPDAVTIREVAGAAGVSPALVVHHFGGKAGLQAAVDEHVAGLFDELFGRLADTDPVELFAAGAGGSLADMMLASLPADSPVPAYLRRLLLTGDAAGQRLFGQWYAAGRDLMAALAAAGALRPGRDPAVRTAFLVVNDLAVLLLRDQLTAVLGLDPLSRDGMVRWAEEVLAVYRDGVFVTGEEES